MITNNDKADKGIIARGKIISEEIVKDTKNIKIKQNTLDKVLNVLDDNTSNQSNNTSESTVSIITNNNKGGKEIVASGKIIEEKIEKYTTNNTIKQNTLDKAPNVLDNNKSDQSKNASKW